MHRAMLVPVGELGVVTIYDESELELLLTAKKFLETGVHDSCLDLLSSLELLRKRRAVRISQILDERLAQVIGSGECADLE